MRAAPGLPVRVRLPQDLTQDDLLRRRSSIRGPARAIIAGSEGSGTANAEMVANERYMVLQGRKTYSIPSSPRMMLPLESVVLMTPLVLSSQMIVPVESTAVIAEYRSEDPQVLRT